ncbi:anti-sigma factor antagonist [Actinomadura sp. KC06]|uniref:STAS domain-containing protein n=1 Tax=Actinomadura sp. KC06 TaxID=2530369 RepID=UPI001045A818|nr:STAS domain-containing protein [Actinomadura sp. KC06]TDD39973.1 anti-sigma factor antagonist [Actinomadura sp. KC06]
MYRGRSPPPDSRQTVGVKYLNPGTEVKDGPSAYLTTCLRNAATDALRKFSAAESTISLDGYDDVLPERCQEPPTGRGEPGDADQVAAEEDIRRELARLTGTGETAGEAPREVAVEAKGTLVHIYELEPGIVVAKIRTTDNEFDVHTAWPVRNALLEWLDDPGKATSVNIVIDLSGIDFIDSTALGVLVMFRFRLRLHGDWFSVVCPNQRPRRLLANTMLDTIFGVHASMDDALAAIRKYMRGPTSRFTWPR